MLKVPEPLHCWECDRKMIFFSRFFIMICELFSFRPTLQAISYVLTLNWFNPFPRLKQDLRAFMCYSTRMCVNLSRFRKVQCIILMRFHCCKNSMENGEEKYQIENILTINYDKSISMQTYGKCVFVEFAIVICQLVNRFIRFYFTSSHRPFNSSLTLTFSEWQTF